MLGQERKQGSARRAQQGVTMMEVLIALLLMTTALLGATALQLTGLQNNRSAYYRSQANLLAYDFADRLRINAAYALGDTDRYSLDTDSPAIPSASSCAGTLNGCSDAQIRDLDLRQWYDHFVDVSGVGQDGSNWEPALPSGAAEVTASGSTFSVSIDWQETGWSLSGGGNRGEKTKNLILTFEVVD